jgi:hypothetical protein
LKDNFMSQMIRKQIYLEAEQAALLKQRAQELGMSEADLIRQCIDQLITCSTPLPFDSSAWRDELAFIRERMRVQKALGQQRSWTREALYDERLQRFSR